jgi:uncharacterized protein (TIGR02246 family)
MAIMLGGRCSMVVAAGAATLAACGPPRSSGQAVALTDSDRLAIRALDTAFVAAWRRDDTVAVLRLFHPDAVLLPPNSAPVEGLEAIKAYWWPIDGSHTRITGFTRDVAEIAGSGDLAFFRGSASLAWVYRKDGRENAQVSRSTDLVVVNRDATGRWRIARQMWTQLPP